MLHNAEDKDVQALHDDEQEAFQEWREFILDVLLRVVFTVGFLALLAGIANATIARQYDLIVVYLAFYAGFVVLAFSKKLSFSLRASMFVFVLYLFGLIGLWAAGLSGDGRTFLFAFVLMTGVLLGTRAAFVALGISLATLVSFGVVLVSGMHLIPTLAQANSADAPSWVSGTLIFTLLTLAGVLPWTYLLARLRKALKEARLAKAEAEEANKAKSLFLAKMSHELRTPLNAIIGYAELLQEDAEESELSHFVEDLERIQASGSNLLSLICDILDFSKLELGRISLQIESFDVPTMLEESHRRIEAFAGRNGNAVHLEVAEDVALMTADRERVQQVLINLLHNAAKFTKNGNITLSVRRFEREGHDWLCFEVADTGKGMTAAQSELVFQAFTQVERHIGELEGFGLGLAICKRLCEWMGGGIFHKPQPDGKGARFFVELPQTILVEGPIPEREVASTTNCGDVSLSVGSF